MTAQLSDKQVKLLHRLTLGSTGIAAGAAGGNLSVKAYQDRPHRKKKTSKERGLVEASKAEAHLEEVAKNSYRRRTVRDPGSELDLIAAARLVLQSQGKKSKVGWLQQRRTNREFQGAIARGYLNAPYTKGNF